MEDNGVQLKKITACLSMTTITKELKTNKEKHEIIYFRQRARRHMAYQFGEKFRLN